MSRETLNQKRALQSEIHPVYTGQSGSVVVFLMGLSEICVVALHDFASRVLQPRRRRYKRLLSNHSFRRTHISAHTQATELFCAKKSGLLSRHRADSKR